MRILSLLGPLARCDTKYILMPPLSRVPLHIWASLASSSSPLTSIPLLGFYSENQTLTSALSRRRRALPDLVPTGQEEVGARSHTQPPHPPRSDPFTSHPQRARFSTLDPARVVAFLVAIFPGSGHRGRPCPSNKHIAHLSGEEHKQHYVSRLRRLCEQTA